MYTKLHSLLVIQYFYDPTFTDMLIISFLSHSFHFPREKFFHKEPTLLHPWREKFYLLTSDFIPLTPAD